MTRWRTITAFDADAKAVEVYRANMPGVEVRCADISLVKHFPRADVLLGGPPCQPFSVAGQRGGSEDARDCVQDFIDAIGVVQPRMFLMEQVPGFTMFENGRYMQRCVAAMEAHGYTVEMRLLDAVHYGVPQFRLRAWFWGVRNGLGIERRWPRPTHVWPWPEQQCMFGGDLEPAVVVGEALELDGWTDRWGRVRYCSRGGRLPGCGDTTLEYRWSDAMLAKHSPASPAPTVQAKWLKGGAEGLIEIDTKQKGTRRSVDAPAPALAGDSRHTLNVRRLTPDECARLQSVPDDWVWPESVAKTHRYRIIGNGWACLMAKRLGDAFGESDPESETVIDLFCGGGLGAVGWHGRAWEYRA